MEINKEILEKDLLAVKTNAQNTVIAANAVVQYIEQLIIYADKPAEVPTTPEAQLEQQNA